MEARREKNSDWKIGPWEEKQGKESESHLALTLSHSHTLSLSYTAISLSLWCLHTHTLSLTHTLTLSLSLLQKNVIRYFSVALLTSLNAIFEKLILKMREKKFRTENKTFLLAEAKKKKRLFGFFPFPNKQFDFKLFSIRENGVADLFRSETQKNVRTLLPTFPGESRESILNWWPLRDWLCRSLGSLRHTVMAKLDCPLTRRLIHS